MCVRNLLHSPSSSKISRLHLFVHTMKPEIRIIKIKRGDWKVQFNIGNQYFDLRHIEGTTKGDAKWAAKMLKLAFKKLT